MCSTTCTYIHVPSLYTYMYMYMHVLHMYTPCICLLCRYVIRLYTCTILHVYARCKSLTCIHMYMYISTPHVFVYIHTCTCTCICMWAMYTIAMTTFGVYMYLISMLYSALCSFVAFHSSLRQISFEVVFSFLFLPCVIS